MTKKNHAQKRALERYGLQLSKKELKEVTLRCINGEGIRTRLDRDGKHYVVFLAVKGIPVRMIYRPENRRVVTFLPYHPDY